MAKLPSLIHPNSFGDNPLRDLLKMQRQMDRFWDEMWTPSCDVEETETHYLMSFDLPGVKKDDIQVDLKDDVLTVSGERKEEREEKNGQRYQSERFRGAFTRSFQVPAGIKAEMVETHYADGVLRVAVPKTQAAKAQQIKISEGKTGFWEKLLGHKKEESQSSGKSSADPGPRLSVKAG